MMCPDLKPMNPMPRALLQLYRLASHFGHPENRVGYTARRYSVDAGNEIGGWPWMIEEIYNQ